MVIHLLKTSALFITCTSTIPRSRPSVSLFCVYVLCLCGKPACLFVSVLATETLCCYGNHCVSLYVVRKNFGYRGKPFLPICFSVDVYKVSCCRGFNKRVDGVSSVSVFYAVFFSLLCLPLPEEELIFPFG